MQANLWNTLQKKNLISKDNELFLKEKLRSEIPKIIEQIYLEREKEKEDG
jgi:hypothetical protein